MNMYYNYPLSIIIVFEQKSIDSRWREEKQSYDVKFRVNATLQNSKIIWVQEFCDDISYIIIRT